jgi:hypothetical protein
MTAYPSTVVTIQNEWETLFILSSGNDASNCSDYTTLTDKMITELYWKLCESGTISGFSWDWGKTMKSLMSA